MNTNVYASSNTYILDNSKGTYLLVLRELHIEDRFVQQKGIGCMNEEAYMSIYPLHLWIQYPV